MTRRAPVFMLALVLLGSFLAVGAAADESKRSQEDYYELYKLLVDTMDQVERNYVKEVDRRELVEAAIKGVLSKLDPYSSYIPPKEIDRFRSSVESEFGGIGIQISVDRGVLKILSPLVGTPAYRAGLMAGDRIVEIEGDGTEGISIDEAVRRLKGKAGTKVKLAVVHRGSSKKVDVVITREIIHVETVIGDSRKEDDSWQFMLRPKEHIGYLRVTAFSRSTTDEIKKALDELKAEKLRGLIVDLRFNPGGLLRSAIEVSDLFISKGRIVSTKGRNTPERKWDAHKSGTYEGFPMVVLVNRYSASASEIVSACLQDHKRAVVMGERTWGKGSVQNVIELENGRSALKLTTASYLRPSGKNIHRFNDAEDDDEWGVMPDEEFRMRLADGELLGLIKDRRRRDILQPKKSGQEEPAEEPAEEPGEEPDEDPAAESDEEPAEDGGSGQPDAEGAEDDGESAEAGEHPAEEPEKSAFIDRQLEMAIEYLTGELARAE